MNTAAEQSVRASTRTKVIGGFLLFIILFAHTTLQIPRLHNNYPYMNYVDEGHIVRHAQNMYRAETLNPHWYQYGASVMNAINLLVRAYALLNNYENEFHESVKMYPQKYFENQYPESYFETEYSIVDPPEFLIAGRVISLATFIVGMLVLYLISTRWLNPITSIFPVLFTISIPTLVQHQTFVNNDIPIMCCFLLCIYLSIRWWETKRYHLLLIAGFIAGIAMGSKYSGLLLLGIPAFLILLARGNVKTLVLRLAPLPFFLLLGYYFSNPGSLGSENEVIKTFLWDKNYYATKGGTRSYINNLVNIKNFGLPFCILSICGILLAIKTAKNRPFSIAISIWVILYLATFMRYDYQPFRNLYCILPVLALFTSLAVATISSQLVKLIKKPAWENCVAVCLLLFLHISQQAPATYTTYKPVNPKTDSRIEVSDWLIKNLSPEDRVVLVHSLAFAPQKIAELRKAGLNVTVLPKLSNLTALNGDEFVIMPELSSKRPLMKAEAAEALELRKAFNDAGRQIVYETGVRKITTFPNFFRDNNMKLEIFSPGMEKK